MWYAVHIVQHTHIVCCNYNVQHTANCMNTEICSIHAVRVQCTTYSVHCEVCNMQCRLAIIWQGGVMSFCAVLSVYHVVCSVYCEVCIV